MKSGGGGWNKKRGLEVRRRGIKEDDMGGMQNGVEKSRARNVEGRVNNTTKEERRWKNVENYRGITLLNLMYKVYAIVEKS